MVSSRLGNSDMGLPGQPVRDTGAVPIVAGRRRRRPTECLAGAQPKCHTRRLRATARGYFIDLNPSWERTLGYTLAELTSRPFLDFVHPDDREPTLAEAARLQEPNTYTVGFANRYRCKDGSYRWLHWHTRVVEGYFYAVARDITDLVKQSEAGDVQASLLLDPESMRRLDPSSD